MTTMSAPNRSDLRRVPRRREPVVHGSTDGAPADRWIAGALMAGDQENKTLASLDCLLERTVDRSPRSVEAHSMQVHHPIWSGSPAGKLAIPASVECCSRDRLRAGGGNGLSRQLGSFSCCCDFTFNFSYLRIVILT